MSLWCALVQISSNSLYPAVVATPSTKDVKTNRSGGKRRSGASRVQWSYCSPPHARGKEEREGGGGRGRARVKRQRERVRVGRDDGSS